jgi:hypothetical protein
MNPTVAASKAEDRQLVEAIWSFRKHDRQAEAEAAYFLLMERKAREVVLIRERFGHQTDVYSYAPCLTLEFDAFQPGELIAANMEPVKPWQWAMVGFAESAPCYSSSNLLVYLGLSHDGGELAFYSPSKAISARFAFEDLSHLAGVVGVASPNVRLRPCPRYEFAEDEERPLVRKWLVAQRIHQVPTPAFDLGTLVQYPVPQVAESSESIH